MGCSFERHSRYHNDWSFEKFQVVFGRKANKIWVDKGSKFENLSMKSWLKDNGIKICLTHNEGKSIVAESYARRLKNKI